MDSRLKEILKEEERKNRLLGPTHKQNLTFDRWEEVFKDPTLTGALIDRLAHKAHILDNISIL